MSELGDQIRQSTRALQATESNIARRASGTLPETCYRDWEDFARLHLILGPTADLLEARKSKFEELTELAASYNRKPDRVPAFDTARFLGLTSYVATSWAVYDRLSNVCGRLLERRLDGFNPKLCFDILPRRVNRKSGGGNSESTQKERRHFSAVWRVIDAAYYWPIQVSYQIRNCLVHEGGYFGVHSLFGGRSPTNEFTLSDAAKRRLEGECEYRLEDNGHIARCCVGPSDPWHRSPVDALSVLAEYHVEIDHMFVGLVQWTVDSFAAQVQAFAARDHLTGPGSLASARDPAAEKPASKKNAGKKKPAKKTASRKKTSKRTTGT